MAVSGPERNAQELAAALAEVAALRGKLHAAEEKIAWLEARLEELLRSVFGRKSEAAERAPEAGAADAPDDGSPPPEGAPQGRPQDPRTGGKKRGRKRGTPNPGRVSRADLPVREELLELPESERSCPRCGQAYVRSGSEVSWLYEIDWQAVARRIRRQQYRPTCACAAARSVLARPAPRLGERTQLGTSVWGWFLVQVFGLFRAQAAAARDLAALGLRVPTATLSQGLRRMAKLLEPVEQAIAQRQAQAAVAQADETSWPVQYIAGQDNPKQAPEQGGKPLYWLWTCLTADTVRMRILPTRGSPSGEQLLGNLGGHQQPGAAPQVIVVCDRWSAYKALARRAGGRIVLQFCWSHQRRDFRKAGTGFAELQPWAEAWLDRIGSVFDLAKRRRQAWQPGLPLDQQDATFHKYQQHLQAAFDGLLQTAREELLELRVPWSEQCDRPHPRGRALARLQARSAPLLSLLAHRKGLAVFLSDPRVPMDNNACERVLRGPVIARYSSFGSGGPHGAHMTGVLFGVLATVRLNGLNPYTWVLDYLAACARNRGAPPRDLTPWLPWQMDEQRQQELRRPPVGWQGTSQRPTSAPADEPPKTLPLAA